MRKLIVAVLAVAALAACAQTPPVEEEKPVPVDPKEPVTPHFSEPELAFAFTESKRYSYCPVVLRQENGDRYVYYCGNPYKDPKLSLQEIVIDNIYMYVEHPDGTRTAEKRVLQPTEGAWDEHHTCDPSVVQGVFKMGGVSYKYAMFYTGCNMADDYNELGVAFSNDLNADSWVKYPEPLIRKTWEEDGPQMIGSSKAWGVGQPSAISLDKAGKILLCYSVGDKSGTKEAFREIDLSDMEHPDTGTVKYVGIFGLKNLNGTVDNLHNCDFALDTRSNKILMSRPMHPFPSDYPAYISSTLEIDSHDFDSFLSGRDNWKKIGRIGKDLSGFPRNHNAGLLRDNYGHVDDYRTPTVYFTVSKAYPNVQAVPGKMAEWSYDIYKTSFITE